MVGIYKITSPTESVYIGQSWNLEKRAKNYKGLQCKRQVKLYNSLVKYSWEKHTFEIIHELSGENTQLELDYWETFYWQKCKDEGLEMLNVKEPGSRGRLPEESRKKIGEANKKRIWSEESKLKVSNTQKGKPGTPHTEETKRKLSELKKGKPNPNKGKPASRPKTEEERKAISERMRGNKNLLGHKHSEETKRKIGEASKGNKNCLGRKLTEEHKKKIGEHQKGDKNASKRPEVRAKLSAALSGENNPMYGTIPKNRKKVEVIATGQVFDCVKEAALSLNLTRTTVRKRARKGETLRFCVL